MIVIKQCHRNPYWLADFVYKGKFSDGFEFNLRIPDEDVVEFANTLLQAYKDDEDGKVEVKPPHLDKNGIFHDGVVERKNK